MDGRLDPGRMGKPGMRTHARTDHSGPALCSSQTGSESVSSLAASSQSSSCLSLEPHWPMRSLRPRGSQRGTSDARSPTMIPQTGYPGTERPSTTQRECDLHRRDNACAPRSHSIILRGEGDAASIESCECCVVRSVRTAGRWFVLSRGSRGPGASCAREATVTVAVAR